MFQVAATIGTALSRGIKWDFPVKINKTEVGELFNLTGKLTEDDGASAYMVYEHQAGSFANFTLPESEYFTQRLVSLHGYFQSSKYFARHNEIINKTFAFDSNRIKRVEEAVPEILLSNTVGVHVRRGDYVNNPLYTNLGIEYYQRALKKLNKKSKIDAVIITSNDIEWSKENMGHLPYNLIFSPLEYPGDDMLLLARCKNLVIANSSFSWWAAYFNMLKFSNGSVVAPRPWYRLSGDFAHLNSEEMYLPNWRVLDVVEASILL